MSKSKVDIDLGVSEKMSNYTSDWLKMNANKTVGMFLGEKHTAPFVFIKFNMNN